MIIADAKAIKTLREQYIKQNLIKYQPTLVASSGRKE